MLLPVPVEIADCCFEECLLLQISLFLLFGMNKVSLLLAQTRVV